MSNQTTSTENLLQLILNALPLAFGVVIVILSLLTTIGIVETLDSNTLLPLLDIGLLCLGLSGLDNFKDQ